MEEAEPLVVRAVARPVDVEDRDDQAGLVGLASDRDVAWMYSEVILGWAKTAIRPSRGMSRPTEIMFVASATSTLLRLAERRGRARPWSSATSVVLYARGQLLRLRSGSRGRRTASRSRPSRRRLPYWFRRLRHLVLDQPARPAQLAQAVEVAEHRHVRVGRIVGDRACRRSPGRAWPRPTSAPGRSCSRTRFGAAALGGDAQVQPGRLLARVTVTAKNESRRSGPGGGKIWTDAGRRAPGSARSARRTVAVEETILGPRPLRVAAQRWSIAVSYRPAIVPSGPEIRCSSSWMIRSGGGQIGIQLDPLARRRNRPESPRLACSS